ncbi:ComF family protein [Thiohalocapsa marina]|uniref:ComF family protein n=1 Tax=Thiohalocapsa marina TaxID=424902 RepID=A0A5M8FVJ4_9GAMM|nr:ComF family protein [Thiohalocapsa marina]KAA6187783.1 ComF family protein [Thiohalocapsa marina]
MIRSVWRDRFADWLYPPTCVLCGAAGADGLDLCRGCRADLPYIGPCCPRCALPLEATAVTADVVCGECLLHPPPFALCSAAFRYQDPLPGLIGGIKFRGRMNLLRLLGLLLATHLRDTATPLPDRIVPVPLHPHRLRQRGYNQALELARVVGGRAGIPVDHGSCTRVIATTPQAQLDQKARRNNLQGAFRTSARLDGLHLTVLDDVVTTGSTVAEVARTLRQAGAARVDVWAVARTP